MKVLSNTFLQSIQTVSMSRNQLREYDIGVQGG
jgi:hypothetical protein